MMINSIIQYSSYLLILIGLAIPLGSYIGKVMNGEKTFLSKILNPVENFIYKLLGVISKSESELLPKLKAAIHSPRFSVLSKHKRSCDSLTSKSLLGISSFFFLTTFKPP